ncbi:hypothetical protein Vretimale_1102 [Volvox reticuliferus]|uniref:Uncharacterized protein n=1 Tax=Volvox reticuliferus TaxID=1737510 RepID=A0A8J4CEK5_9CHLO|nr:hypothetical protein Vretifemale_10412 [Volvox reticuliferus]GIL94988.1 hypothetical protein Vretimale_1102 [Volvox reticuliferus]
MSGRVGGWQVGSGLVFLNPHHKPPDFPLPAPRPELVQEGDSPGHTSLLRATTATATTTTRTTGARVNAAIPMPSPGSIVAMGSLELAHLLRRCRPFASSYTDTQVGLG